MIKCTSCGFDNQDGSKFCKQCGNKLEAPTEKFCKRCGKPWKDGAMFCISCGANRNGEQQGTPAPRPPVMVPKHQTPQKQKQVREPEDTGDGSVGFTAAIIVVIVLILLVAGYGVYAWISSDGLPEIFEGSRQETQKRVDNDDGLGRYDEIQTEQSDAEDENGETHNEYTAPSNDTISISGTSSAASQEIQEAQPARFILPNSSTQYLTRSDLEGLSAEECRIARNEIYARHGRKFSDEGLQSYFNSMDWYEGTIEAGDFTETMLNEYEIANRDLIVSYEEEQGYR